MGVGGGLTPLEDNAEDVPGRFFALLGCFLMNVQTVSSPGVSPCQHVALDHLHFGPKARNDQNSINPDLPKFGGAQPEHSEAPPFLPAGSLLGENLVGNRFRTLTPTSKEKT